MANILVDKWPESKEEIYDNKQWVPKEWTIGEPITKEKLQNLDDGIAVLATQIKAILGEFNPSSLDNAQLNASRLDIIQKWITAAEDGTYDLTKGSIAARLANIDTLNTTQNNRLNSIESVNSTQSTDISSLKTRATDIEALNTTQNGRLNNIESKNTEQDSRLDTLESTTSAHTTKLSAIETLNTTQDNRLTNLENRADNIETLNTTQNNRLDTLTTDINSLETKVGDGDVGIYGDISNTIRHLSDTVARLDPTGSAEAVGFLVSEVWGQTFSTDTDFTANSRIDDLETTTQSLGTQLTTLASEKEELKQKLATTDAKIPIELYEAKNTSASDTIVLDTTPRDKSIFFIAIPLGTLGTSNLKLETNDITFRDTNNTTVTIKKNFSESLIAKYPPNSLISIYRNGANAYAYNVPMIL